MTNLIQLQQIRLLTVFKADMLIQFFKGYPNFSIRLKSQK